MTTTKNLHLTKVILLSSLLLILCGCSFNSEITEPHESTSSSTPQTESSTTPPITEPIPESAFELTKERDRENLSLRFQPTQEVTAGEDVRYYAPSNQAEWITAFEDTLAKANSTGHWEPADSSTGIWICYQDHWWNLLTNGEILTIGSGRISSTDASQIYGMCMDAAKDLNMGTPVRPNQIKNIKSATLDWGEIYTITDVEKLQILEQWLSASTELYGGANCWFTALLTLKLENGDVLTLSIATDSCCTWLSEGVFYEYGSFDNAEFFALFTGKDTVPEPEQPEPTEGIVEETQQESPGTMEYTPDQDDFVRISDYIPNVDVELAYATAENFTQQTIYDFSDAYLRYGTLQKLMNVCEELKDHNLTLKIWDAYRPIPAQARLWEACPDPTYVSPPDTGNRTHCRGNAVDVTLIDQDGDELEMPSGFDDFSIKGDRDYSDCTETAAANAQLLQGIMEKHGFKGYSGEWWHFTDKDTYPIEETFMPVKVSWQYADCNEYISLRLQPSTSAKTLLRIPANNKLQMLATNGDFAFVSYNGTTGYVLKKYIQPVKDSLRSDTPSIWIANCNEYISLRNDAGGSEVIAQIPTGGQMTLLGWYEKYALVEYGDTTGYVLSSYIMPEDTDCISDSLSTVNQTHLYSYDQMISDIETLTSKYPGTASSETIGYSELGRAIPVLCIGSVNADHHVLLQGAIHGREHMTAWLLMAIADYCLTNDSLGNGNVCYHIIPMSNPDGVSISQSGVLNEAQQSIYQSDKELGYTTANQSRYATLWKANGLGVDINRNFPSGREDADLRNSPSSQQYGGNKAFSSSEAAALRDYTLKYPFDATISYHANGSIIYYEFGNNREVNDQSKSLAYSVKGCTGYPLYGSNGVEGAGYKDWAIDELQIPSITIEIGCGSAPLAMQEIYSIFYRNIDVLSAIESWIKAD